MSSIFSSNNLDDITKECKNDRQSNEWLLEIAFIRPILLIMLVSYHAFCYNCGSWIVPHGVTANETYKWLSLFSYSFLLEGYMFISGYIFALQVMKKGRYQNLKQLIAVKFKRIIIPYLIFGCIYYCMFNWGETPIIILNGIGHLWFLPCLFWCFIGAYIIYKSNIKRTLALLLLVLFIPISVAPIPLQINKALYYIVFFLLGGLFWEKSKQIREFATPKSTLISCVFFILFCVVNNIVIEYLTQISSNEPIWIKAIYMSISKYIKAILACSGIITVYMCASRFIQTHTIKKWVMGIGDLAMGVYIFHQFILKYIFYCTDIPMIVGSQWLPWLGLIITIIGSIFLSYIFKKSKIGQRLI